MSLGLLTAKSPDYRFRKCLFLGVPIRIQVVMSEDQVTISNLIRLSNIFSGCAFFEVHHHPLTGDQECPRPQPSDEQHHYVKILENQMR